VTDTLGLLLVVHVHAADIQDRDGGVAVVSDACHKYPTLRTLLVDSGYSGRCSRAIEEQVGIAVEIVRRSDDSARGTWQGPQLPVAVPCRGFIPLPKRWAIERTHAWTSRPRRMAKDFDQRLDVSEAWIWLVQASLLLRRVAEPVELERSAVAA
jgi:transposase